MVVRPRTPTASKQAAWVYALNLHSPAPRGKGNPARLHIAERWGGEGLAFVNHFDVRCRVVHRSSRHVDGSFR